VGQAAEIHGKVLESRPRRQTARQLADALVNADCGPRRSRTWRSCRSPLATTNTWVTLGQALQKAPR
jgi:hypothetical protein